MAWSGRDTECEIKKEYQEHEKKASKGFNLPRRPASFESRSSNLCPIFFTSTSPYIRKKVGDNAVQTKSP